MNLRKDHYWFWRNVLASKEELCTSSKSHSPVHIWWALERKSRQLVINFCSLHFLTLKPWYCIWKSNVTTFNNGSLGSRIDEERSELRYVMWIAEFSESSNLWTHIAPSGIPEGMPVWVSLSPQSNSGLIPSFAIGCWRFAGALDAIQLLLNALAGLCMTSSSLIQELSELLLWKLLSSASRVVCGLCPSWQTYFKLDLKSGRTTRWT